MTMEFVVSILTSKEMHRHFVDATCAKTFLHKKSVSEHCCTQKTLVLIFFLQNMPTVLSVTWSSSSSSLLKLAIAKRKETRKFHRWWDGLVEATAIEGHQSKPSVRHAQIQNTLGLNSLFTRLNPMLANKSCFAFQACMCLKLLTNLDHSMYSNKFLPGLQGNLLWKV